MKKRDLEKFIKQCGWWQKPGSKHDKWTNGELSTMVPRHAEINEHTARGIMKTVRDNPPKGETK